LFLPPRIPALIAKAMVAERLFGGSLVLAAALGDSESAARLQIVGGLGGSRADSARY
jgi:hypothetical protein